MSITRDEWLKALGEADCQDDPEALSPSELAALLGVTTTCARFRIKKLVELGRAIRVTKIMTRPDGGRIRVPAYKLLQP